MRFFLLLTFAGMLGAIECPDGSTALNVVCMGTAPSCAGECGPGQTAFGECNTGSSCWTGSKVYCGNCPAPAPTTYQTTNNQQNTNNGNGNTIGAGSGTVARSNAPCTTSKSFAGLEMMVGLITATIAALSF